MKKLVCLLCAAMVLSLAGCGGGKEIPDLTGEWEAAGDSGESYQVATITEDTITIYWSSEDASALYWAGSFVPPTSADEPYTWESVNDTEQTDHAIMASTDDTKTFTYEDGKISYEVSAFGVTGTVSLEKK